MGLKGAAYCTGFSVGGRFRVRVGATVRDEYTIIKTSGTLQHQLAKEKSSAGPVYWQNTESTVITRTAMTHKAETPPVD